MDKTLSNYSYVVVDVETTGLSPDDRICEIGMTKIENNEIVDSFESLINPEEKINNTIFHGIEDWMVRGAPVFGDVAHDIIDFMQDSVLIAHNAPFDMRFLRYEFSRLGTDLSHLSLCTLKISRRLHPEFVSHRLDHVLYQYDIINKQHHRAGTDAESEARLFLEMKLKLEDRGLITLDSLNAWGLPYDHRWTGSTTIASPRNGGQVLTRDDL
jgi:DNA polymerase III epsilon subunit family exonuclease